MKTWLITGASRGLGAALAAEVLRRGDRAILGVRRPGGEQALVDAYPARALVVELDVDNPQSIARGVATSLDWSPEIDVLVNNAGRGLHGAIEEVSDAEARALFETNIFGLLSVTRAVLPAMRQRRTGHVINIGSVAGLAGDAGTGVYCATKFALEGISEALNVELKPLGIKVTIVEPGPFRTDFNGSSLQRSAQRIDDYEATAAKRAKGLRSGSGKQPGNPAAAASLICDIVALDAPPLHLVLGAPGMARARGKLERFAAELAAWEPRSAATGFPDAAG